MNFFEDFSLQRIDPNCFWFRLVFDGWIDGFFSGHWDVLKSINQPLLMFHKKSTHLGMEVHCNGDKSPYISVHVFNISEAFRVLSLNDITISS